MIIPIPPMLSHEDKTRQHAPDIYGNEITTYRSTYTQKAQGMPQLVLVEQPEPGSVLLPHYHASDQFQVFMDGDGMLGKHALHPVSIHYTNKFTGYGPIVAGPNGVTYYVMRPSFDPLGPGQYLHVPELREKVKRYTGKRRTLVADGIDIKPVEDLRAVSAPQSNTLFEVGESEPDRGTLALQVVLGPGMSWQAPDPASGGGQVLLVLQGELQTAGFAGGPRSALAVTCDESAVTIAAGLSGVQLIVLQYPRPHDLEAM